MPSSARKSSVGASRRGLVKPHVPYRGDNPDVGKKTGITVQAVQRKSDGFEPFEDVLGQADDRTPPQVKARKRAKHSILDEEVDENGEMSMELDNSPLPYFSNARLPQTASGSNRRRSSSRSVARAVDVDYDHLPSPHSHASSRRSYGISSGGPGPSNLSHSTNAGHFDFDLDPIPPADDFDDDDNEPFDNYDAPSRGDMRQRGEGDGQEDSPRRASFAAIDEDDHELNGGGGQEDYEEEEVSRAVASTQKGKKAATVGKRKERSPDPQDDDVEEDIARRMEAIEEEDEEEEEPEEERPKPKAGRSKKDSKKQATVAMDGVDVPSRKRSHSKKENKPVRAGIRRSAREHYKPLEWWRGEKLVYGRSDSGPVLVPHIKEIRRLPKEEPIPLGSLGKRKRSGRSQSKAVEIPPNPHNPEEGWDDDTEQHCIVLDYPSRTEVLRRIAFTAKMVQPQPAANNEWFFQKVFGDGEFMAAGQLVIPPNGRKPTKDSKDNTYIFYVIEGAVNLKVNTTSVVLATGGMFMVPRGNTYYLENIANRDARIFFTQARQIQPQTPEERARSTSSTVRAPSKAVQ